MHQEYELAPIAAPFPSFLLLLPFLCICPRSRLVGPGLAELSSWRAGGPGTSCMCNRGSGSGIASQGYAVQPNSYPETNILKSSWEAPHLWATLVGVGLGASAAKKATRESNRAGQVISCHPLGSGQVSYGSPMNVQWNIMWF